jgi:response regulator of citrate/malate metabolism
MKLIVLSNTQSDPEEWPAGWDQATFDELQAGLQADLVKLTSTGPRSSSTAGMTSRTSIRRP